MINLKLISNNIYVVKPYDRNSADCCVYMVNTKSDDGLILIDVGLNIEPIHEIVKEGFKIKDIKHCLITHCHLDHIGACNELKKLNNEIKFYAHELDAKKIEQVPMDEYITQYYADYNYVPVKLYKKFKLDNEILKFGQLEIRVIHIPGHSPGSVAYYLDNGKNKILFGGDLPGIAINLHGGDLEAYLNSLTKLLDLKIDILCEGHEDIIEPAKKVQKFIKGYMNLNKFLNKIVVEDPSNVEVLIDLILQTYDLGFYDVALDFCNYLLEIVPNNIEGQNLLKKIRKHNPPKIDFIKSYIKETFPEFINQLQKKD
ncbi:MAG: MBL fold metallo-hydrolase [Promethearchaeota archaeon]